MNSSIPDHIAIIPDGNRRWARGRGFHPTAGHKKGAENFKTIMRAAFRAGIPYLTLWVASEDNLLKRSRLEVRFLVAILRRELRSKGFRQEIAENEVSVQFAGRSGEILHDVGLTKLMHMIERETAHFKKFHLTVLFGYDGRREMLEAVKKMQKEKTATTNESLRAALWTGNLPPVDLVIRTGEEELGWSHWSAGFMMWQAAEAQFYFTKTFWPGFTEDEFKKALEGYAMRERRFGK